MGHSTEHTAYLRLKKGVPAPRSGSAELNGKVVSEQIGAQIFIDGWGMVAAGDPELAADLARRAGSVSHDGEAIYGAQVLAAMEALAFVEDDLDTLIDTAVSFIPKDSVIYRLIADLRGWHAAESDWRRTRELLARDYGYHKYGGNCHMVPNHGVVILGLLYSEGDFQRALMVTNTCGWDTDCNSGNVGCLMGIWKGLAGIEAGPDWRGPVADRLFLPTADGGRCITDAVAETYEVANIGRALAGLPALAPKDGARLHFELPGSLQGVQPEGLAVENVAGHSRLGSRSLALRYRYLATGGVARLAVPTFIPPSYLQASGYGLLASPKLYSGQEVRARISADSGNTSAVTCSLYIDVYGPADGLVTLAGPGVDLAAGAEHDFAWLVPDTGGSPIAEVGLELWSPSGERVDGTLYLDYLTWGGTPRVTLGRPQAGGSLWHRAWTNGVDRFSPMGGGAYSLIHDEGTGLAIQGTREWKDYRAITRVTPHMVESTGLGVRVQGMRRYYALLLCQDGKVRLVKALDGYKVLAEEDFAWEPDVEYELSVEVEGCSIRGLVNGTLLFEAEDAVDPLTGGAVALICEEGRVAFGAVTVEPV